MTDVLHVSLSLSDHVAAALQSRVREGGYLDLADYVRGLIEADVADDDEPWEMTPELADALAQGERSGISWRSPRQILKELLGTKL